MCPEMGTFARLEPRYKSIFSPVHCSALRAMYEPAKKCAFHPDGDEDEEDEEEGEFGWDDVPVCYSPPAGKVKQTALPNTIFLPWPLWQYSNTGTPGFSCRCTWLQGTLHRDWHTDDTQVYIYTSCMTYYWHHKMKLLDDYDFFLSDVWSAEGRLQLRRGIGEPEKINIIAISTSSVEWVLKLTFWHNDSSQFSLKF